jgi:putative FmdB family regulatory protein
MRYPFICENCGEFEFEVKISDMPLKKCPHCNDEKIERVFKPITSIWKCDGTFSRPNHKE